MLAFCVAKLLCRETAVLRYCCVAILLCCDTAFSTQIANEEQSKHCLVGYCIIPTTAHDSGASVLNLATQTQTLDERTVTRHIRLRDVLEQATTTSD